MDASGLIAAVVWSLAATLFGASDGGAQAGGEPVRAAPAGLSGPRELWTLLGVDESHFEHLSDGVPWQESEDEILLRMMYRMREFRPQEMEAWAHDAFPEDLAEKSPRDELDALRGEVFRLRGRVVLVEAIRLPAEFTQRYEMGEYYRAEFLLEDGRTAVVFARLVPRRWQRNEPLEERAVAPGFFLKLAGDGQGVPVFATQRIAWYPDTLLGNLGMDVGLLDDLQPAGEQPARRLGQMRLTLRNREAFYQMLAAVGRAEPDALFRQAEEELRRSGAERFSVVPLFNSPGSQHGRLVMLSGTAREVVPVHVPDEDVRARFGIDHYYQVGLFPDDSQGNPLVFCVREIPEGMPTGKGPQFGQYVTVAGFFFNTWAYRSQAPAEGDSGAEWQLAPLLIGRTVVWHPRQPPARNPATSAVAAAAFVLVLAVIWLALWRYSRRDRDFRRKTLAKHLGGEPDAPLSELGIEASSGPDFSQLEQPGDNRGRT